MIAKHLDEELPFMATETILMAAVAAGGDRQDLHERIRRHSQAAAAVVKEQGGANDLMARLAADPAFAGIDLTATLDPVHFIGRAPQQVDEFISRGRGPDSRPLPRSAQAKGRSSRVAKRDTAYPSGCHWRLASERPKLTLHCQDASGTRVGRLS